MNATPNPTRGDDRDGRGPRILVCGWAGAGNIGDELLTREVVALLRGRGAEPVVVSRDPAATRIAHGVDSVSWGPRGLAAIRGIHGVCVGPGGLFQDTSSLWSLPGNLSLPVLAALRGRPIASVGVGAEPLQRRSSGWLLRRVLSGSPVVTRDRESSEALSAVGVESETGIDLVFGLTIPPMERRREILVAIGPAVGPATGVAKLRPAATRLEPVPAKAIAAAVQRLAAGLGCELVFAAFRGDRDRVASRQVAALLSRGASRDDSSDQSSQAVDHRFLDDDVDAHVAQVAASRLVVASRYHPVVLAARSGTPSVVVSGQAKLGSLVEQIRGSELHASFHAPSWAELPDAGDIAEPFAPVALIPDPAASAVPLDTAASAVPLDALAPFGPDPAHALGPVSRVLGELVAAADSWRRSGGRGTAR